MSVISIYNLNLLIFENIKIKLTSIFYRVISFVWPNMVTHAKRSCSSSECFKGYFAELFYNVQTLLNFTYDLRIGHGYGRKMENGSWTSTIGNILM